MVFVFGLCACTGTEQYMVCSDIAARGLDIPEIAHIVMFDFPLNPIDYLHRAGRCGRAGRKGILSADIVLPQGRCETDLMDTTVTDAFHID